MWQLGGCACCYAHWGGLFGREISYLGVAGLDTPIWDVLAPQGEQERGLKHLRMCSRSPAIPIRQVVPVGLAQLRFCCWAHWAQHFILKFFHLASYTVHTHIVLILVHLGNAGWVDGYG
jgi:hypothetical protein